MPRTFKYVADFETTTDEDGSVRVWLWTATNVDVPENWEYGKNIESFFKWCLKKRGTIYFHNLKFDGTFILSYLLSTGLYRQALRQDKHGDYYFDEDKLLSNGQFKYMISDMGQWYEITLKYQGHFIRFRDSLKLLPFSVKKIGKDFNVNWDETVNNQIEISIKWDKIFDENKEYEMEGAFEAYINNN